MIKRKVFSMLLVAFSLGCGEQLRSSNKSQGSNDPLTIGQHCYPGRQNDNKACLPLVDIVDVAAANRAYRYKDPYKSNDFPRGFLKEYYEGPLRVVDLSNTSGLLLSPNFSAQELLRLSSGRYGVFSTRVLQILQEMRTQAGAAFRVNSGYRSPGHNSGVDGSASWSRHTYGDAIDFSSPGISIRNLQTLCNRFGATYTQLYRSHIHCDWRYETRDTAFYRDVDQLPTPASLELHQVLNDQVELEVRSSGRAYMFSVSGLIKEDIEEGLLFEWTLTTPSGGYVYSENEVFERVLNERGNYRLRVIIGGNTTIDRVLTIQ